MPSKVVYSSASVRLTHKTIENAKGPKLLRHNGDVALVVRVSPKGAKTFHEAGGPDAYFGYPRQATAAEGAASFAIMAEALAVAVDEALRR